MRSVLQAGAVLVVLTSTALAHADPDEATHESQSANEVAPSETHMRSPAMIGIGTAMIIVGVPNSAFAGLMLAFIGPNIGGIGLGGIELYTTGSFMTLAAGIVLVAFGATQVKTDTWQTGLWITPGGVAGRF